MRIVHVISNLGFGGGEQLLFELLAHCDTKKNEHIVIYFRPGHFETQISKLGIKTYPIKGLIAPYDPIAYYRLLTLIKHLKPDLIHSSLWSANIMARLVAKQLNIPIICDMHGNLKHHGRFRNWLDRLTAGIPTTFIAVSEGVKKSFETEVLGKPDARVKVILNGVDADKVRREANQNPLTRAELGIGEHDFVVGSIGRLNAIKSYDVLIRAIARLGEFKKIKLILVGGGPEEAMLKKLAHDLGIEKNVIFTGFRPDARRFYPLFNCFALSSQSEGISVALLEAMCFGLPVITTHDSDKHEVVTDGREGYLAPINESEKLALAIQKLYQNPIVAHEMGNKGKELVESKFSMTNMIEDYERVLNSGLLS